MRLLQGLVDERENSVLVEILRHCANYTMGLLDADPQFSAAIAKLPNLEELSMSSDEMSEEIMCLPMLSLMEKSSSFPLPC